VASLRPLKKTTVKRRHLTCHKQQKKENDAFLLKPIKIINK
jgi:hypothetical protein